MLVKIEKFLSKTHITPTSWLIGLSGIMVVRFFLEALSSPTSSGIIASDASTLIHYYLYFLSLALVFMMFLWFALPKWRKVVPQFVLFSFVMIFLAPILDFIITKGHGLRLTYLFDKPENIPKLFFTYFGPDWKIGATIGIRIELALILLSIGTIIYRIQNSLKRAIIYTFILYSTIFILYSLPVFISIGSGLEPEVYIASTISNSATLLNNLHGTLVYAYPVRALEIGFNFMIGRIWFIIASLLGVIWFYLSDKNKTISVFKNSRPERVAFHLLAVGLGLLLANAVSPSKPLNWNDIASIIVLLISFFYSFIFAICVNDIEDTDIDEVTNKNRPLIQKDLDHQDMRQIANMSLLASLLGSFLVGYYAFFFMLSFTALYFIYSAPPTRFKRIPFFSSFLIALAVLTEVMAGFFLISDSKTISTFPAKAIFAVVLITFLWSHIRDIKDIEGDSKAGVDTVAVLWGEKLVGIMASISFLLIPMFTQFNILWITSIPASIATYHFCTKKPYRELPVFLTYFIFILISGIILFI